MTLVKRPKKGVRSSASKQSDQFEYLDNNYNNITYGTLVNQSAKEIVLNSKLEM